MRIWWDYQLGSFCSDAVIGGLGQFVTPDEIATASGVTLTPEDRAELQRQFDERPPMDAYTASLRISKVAFMDRFTDQELVAIYSAAKQSVAVEIWLDRFKLSEFIDLADGRTASGVHSLESAGLLGAGRAAQILRGQ